MTSLCKGSCGSHRRFLMRVPGGPALRGWCSWTLQQNVNMCSKQMGLCKPVVCTFHLQQLCVCVCGVYNIVDTQNLRGNLSVKQCTFTRKKDLIILHRSVLLALELNKTKQLTTSQTQRKEAYSQTIFLYFISLTCWIRSVNQILKGSATSCDNSKAMLLHLTNEHPLANMLCWIAAMHISRWETMGCCSLNTKRGRMKYWDKDNAHSWMQKKKVT